MRILLITEVFPPQTGGSGRWFWEIYRRFDPNETTILAGAHSNDEAFDQTHKIDVQRVPMSFPTWGVFSRAGFECYRRLSSSIATRLRQQPADQLHCGKILPEGFVAWWLKRKQGVPYVVYVHGEELNIAARSRELRWMTHRVFRSADRVIANSQNTSTLLQNDWSIPAAQLSVLHPGVDINRFHPSQRDADVRQQLGWNDRPVILTVGRLQKRKGHDQLLRAIKNLVPAHPNVLYSIIGDGPEKDALKGLVHELGISDSVEFRGEVSDDEMVSCYQQCDLFALPNRAVDGDFEGFGMVLLEAQACGRPVLTGESGGTGEAMLNGKTGFRVDCESTSILAAKIQTLLDDRAMAEAMGQHGREWTVQNFAWDALVQKASREFQLDRTSDERREHTLMT